MTPYDERYRKLLDLAESVGTQWELRPTLARTDQRLGHDHASVGALVDRRFLTRDLL